MGPKSLPGSSAEARSCALPPSGGFLLGGADWEHVGERLVRGSVRKLPCPGPPCPQLGGRGRRAPMSVSRSLWNEEAFPLLLPALCSRRAVGDLGGWGWPEFVHPLPASHPASLLLGPTPRELRLGLLNFLGTQPLMHSACPVHGTVGMGHGRWVCWRAPGVRRVGAT